jgi:hypothetical protein
LDGGGGRFVAAFDDFGEAAFEIVREPGFRGFFDIF